MNHFFRNMFLAAFLLVIGFAASGNARAQDEFIIDNSEEAVISGFVDDVYYNTFTMLNGFDADAPPITVRLEDIDLQSYNSLDSLINEGMRVRVYGRLVDGNTLLASRIVHDRGWSE